MPTMNNVKEAFEGESVAVRKYLAFAEIAQREGFIHAAKLFRALAESKTIHANIHLKQTGMVLSTEKNIQYAHNLEGSISEKRYQEMIDEAIKDGNKQAAQGFEYKKNIERGYAALCEKALNNLKSDESIDYYVCRHCGNIAEITVPETCPICKSMRHLFVKSC